MDKKIKDGIEVLKKQQKKDFQESTSTDCIEIESFYREGTELEKDIRIINFFKNLR